MFSPRRRRPPGAWGRYGWGAPPRGWGRPPGYGWYRPRTRVRVYGCCLPIPLGVMIAGALGARTAVRVGRR
jgi:hypothetical protein